jgi:hypothetical protein
MKGIIGKVEHLRGLLDRHSAYKTLGRIIEDELGLLSWRELTDSQAVAADEHAELATRARAASGRADDR